MINFYRVSIFRRPRANFHIRVPQVLVIDEKGEKLGVLNISEALKMAQEKGFDLVEIVPNPPGGGPPITRIMDLGKWLYEKEKSEKKEAKIIRIGLTTNIHDLEVKSKKVEEFLKENHKVHIELQLRGRQMAMKDLGREKIRKFLEIIKEKEPFETESEIKSQGRSLSIIIKKK